MKMTNKLQGMVALTLALGLVSIAVARPADSAHSKLAPRVAAVYQAGQAGTLHTTDKRGRPIRKPFGPHFDAQGRVQVVICYTAGVTPDLTALRRLGARIQFNVATLHAVELFLPPDKLTTAARLPWVQSMRLPHYAMPQGSGGSSTSASAVDADALKVMHVQQLRTALHVSGAGVKVLVMSDGVDHWQDVADKGALPKKIWVDPNAAGSGDEGTVMLQLVHAIAPDAELGFCSVSSGGVSRLGCLNDAVTEFAAVVIVNDFGSFADDRFGYEGQFVSAYRNFLTSHPHVAVVQSAGNSEHAFFRGHFVASTKPLTLNGVSYQSVEDWGVATNASSDDYNSLKFPKGQQMLLGLQWDDHWANSQNDYDLYLLNGEGAVVASSTNRQPGNTPVETIAYQPSAAAATLRVVVACRSGTCNNDFLLHGFTHDMKLAFTYQTKDATIGPVSGQRAAVTVGAVNVDDPDTIEPYSQHGPYTIEYPSADSIPKPDLVAPDCVTIVPAGAFQYGFCGTSAAAPQVAGILALLKSAQVPGNRQTLYNSAVDLGDPGRDNIYGHGRVDAAAAGALMLHDAPPTAKPLDAFTVTAGKHHDGALKGALSDNGAKAGLTLQFKITQKPKHGALKLDADSGQFTYTADTGYSGTDNFKFVASDGLLQSDEETGYVTVKRASTTSPSPDPNPPSSGGGGFGFLALLPLLFALRRRKC